MDTNEHEGREHGAKRETLPLSLSALSFDSVNPERSR